MRYTICRSTNALGSPDATWEGARWQAAQTLEVTNFSWPDSGHHPPTSARVLYDDDYLGIIFRVEDRYVRAVAEKFQDGVCTDSCVEFFVAPLPDSDGYFNFEVNCGGTMLVHRCVSQAEREAGLQPVDVTEEDWHTIAMATTLPRIVEPEITEPTTWTVEYHVPLALFTSNFGCSKPTSATEWKGNFYKCADKTSHPHWGSWAPVETERPSFHQPAFFQPILFD